MEGVISQIIFSPSIQYSGNFFIDEDVLRMFEGPDVDLLKSLPYLPSFFAQPLPPRYAIDRTEEPLPDLFLDEERLKSRAPQVNTTEPETATKETSMPRKLLTIQMLKVMQRSYF